MDISIFDVIGPVMVGPSSSHTAGAVRLGRIAGQIAGRDNAHVAGRDAARDASHTATQIVGPASGLLAERAFRQGAEHNAPEPYTHVLFRLHGSFAKTCKGHGTDRALLAGVMGLREDDEDITHAFELAAGRNLAYAFEEVTLEDAHENSAEIVFSLASGGECRVEGASVGGGQVLIRRVNGFDFTFSAQCPTLLITQYDRKGIVSQITGVIAENDINIGTIRLSRKAKGDVACCVIETDGCIPQAAVEKITGLPNVISARLIQMDPL